MPWQDFDATLSGPARPGGYGVIRRRAASLGNETGAFEAWISPLKLLYGFAHRAFIRRRGPPTIPLIRLVDQPSELHVAVGDGASRADGYVRRKPRVTAPE